MKFIAECSPEHSGISAFDELVVEEPALAATSFLLLHSSTVKIDTHLFLRHRRERFFDHGVTVCDICTALGRILHGMYPRFCRGKV